MKVALPYIVVVAQVCVLSPCSAVLSRSNISPQELKVEIHHERGTRSLASDRSTIRITPTFTVASCELRV
jgi:hypothetical protein